MKPTGIGLFAVAIVIFLFSMAGLTRGTDAGESTGAMKVSGTVDVGNLPLDQSGAVKVAAGTPAEEKSTVMQVEVGEAKPFNGGFIYESDPFPTAGWRTMTAVAYLKHANGLVVPEYPSTIRFQHVSTRPFFDGTGGPDRFPVLGGRAKVQTREVPGNVIVEGFTVYLAR